MLVSYKEKRYWIISILVLFLDGIISYYLPSYFNKLSLFYPMLTISLIPFLYSGNKRKYYYFVFILGIIYDLLYCNIFLFNALIFLFLSKIDIKVLKLLKDNFFLYLGLIVLNIVIYDGICFFLLILTKYANYPINHLFYKIEHSLLLNILSGIWFFFIFKKNKIPS